MWGRVVQQLGHEGRPPHPLSLGNPGRLALGGLLRRRRHALGRQCGRMLVRAARARAAARAWQAPGADYGCARGLTRDRPATYLGPPGMRAARAGLRGRRQRRLRARWVGRWHAEAS